MKKVLLLLFLALFLTACTFPAQTPPVQTPTQPAEPVHNLPPDDLESLPIEEREYQRISLQPVPEDAEMRDGVYVYRPYVCLDFFSYADLYGSEAESMTGFSDDTHLAAKDYYGFFEDFSMGCSIWCAASDKCSTKASSTLKNTENISYSADNLFSADRSTAWCEGVQGDGIGEYIDVFYTLGHYADLNGEDTHNELSPDEPYTYEISKDPFDFTSLCIVNGYAKSEALWQKNARVKTLKLYVNDSLTGYIELEDTIMPQYFVLYDIPGQCGVETAFRFEIAAVYKGDEHADTCLSGIVFGFRGPFWH